MKNTNKGTFWGNFFSKNSMNNTIQYCETCRKKTQHDTKFRLGNFPFIKTLACKECGNMFFY